MAASKGVGIYFIGQSPMDIPESILGWLGMKIQHALRAFTPKDKKAGYWIHYLVRNRSTGKPKKPL